MGRHIGCTVNSSNERCQAEREAKGVREWPGPLGGGETKGMAGDDPKAMIDLWVWVMRLCN
jgi:hypothetical protein